MTIPSISRTGARAGGPAHSWIRPLAAVLLLAFVALPASAQKRRKKAPQNDPASCPYCHNDPEIMARAGIVSHGGFEFGSGDTAAVDAFLFAADIRWIESEHFELGMGVGRSKVTAQDKKKLIAELERLTLVMEDVNPRTKVIDPWLRAHIYAQRAEDVYARFLEIIQVDQEKFPDGKTLQLTGADYYGEGPHLGQKGKYEFILLPSQSMNIEFLTENFGLKTFGSQRWNIIPRDTLILVAHTDQGSLKKDAALHGHVAFSLTHNLLDGYCHYSYDLPVWLKEGMGHFIEREINPRYNTFDASEGAIAQKTAKSDWDKEVKSMIRGGDAPRLAELSRLKSYAEFDVDDHFATWSMVAFMVLKHGDEFAAFLSEVKGRRTPDGYPDGSNLPDAFRQALKTNLGMNYQQFDTAWQEWALAGGTGQVEEDAVDPFVDPLLQPR